VTRSAPGKRNCQRGSERQRDNALHDLALFPAPDSGRMLVIN
jgi:hypothetical protein